MNYGLLVTMCTEYFDDCSRSPYGMALSEVLMKKDLTWQWLTSRLLQKKGSRNVGNGSTFPSREMASIALYGQCNQEVEEKGQ